MDFRHFELQDLLADALIALAAGNHARVEQALRQALAWVEADWLATPSELRWARPTPSSAEAEADDDD